jgi:hypothetical protein
MKDRLIKYLKSDRHVWWTVTVLPGIYSVLYLYTHNFTLVNSWIQLAASIAAFILLPVIEILILDWIFKRWLPRWRSHLYWSYLLINFAIILSLTVYLGWRWKALIIVAIISIVSAFFLARHYKKIVVLIGLMTVIGLYQFAHFYIERVIYRDQWQAPQEFEEFTFVQKPNIYLIQPDGFVGKTAAASSLYDIDLTNFYRNLEYNDFTINHDYRSNYPSTLTSNTALFTGQHHFFEYGNMENELFNARDIIVGDNPVLSTFQNNGYHTNLILEHSYLLLNFPDMAYDYCNVRRSELKAPIPNYQLDKNYLQDFRNLVTNASDQPQFTFIEILHPGHISVNEDGRVDLKSETENYKTQLHDIIPIIKEMIAFLKKKDPGAIIIIAADHGGFAGWPYTGKAYQEPTEDASLKASIYSALLAIKAPRDFSNFQQQIKSPVSLFPNLIHYLADQPLPDPRDNSSYIFIKSGANRGVYQYFNTDGDPVTQKLD